MSWKKWLENRITDSAELASILSLSPEEESEFKAILDRFPMQVPKYYLSLIDFNDPEDPIRKMCLPSMAETNMAGSFDTSGEESNTIITGAQHKYAQTVLVLSTNNCAMYCRHCFRKRMVGMSDEEVLNNFDKTVDYISSHKEVSNVLISGGDAFLNSNANIRRFLDVLCGFEHLDCIRFGTRTPVVLPQRIYEDMELLDILKTYCAKKQLYVVTQFNHPRELTAEAKMAIDALHGCGVLVKNQTVLLRGVNDNADSLAELMRGLTGLGIIPYYLFQCRPVSGVGTQFQVPLREGCSIVDEAKSKLSGLAKCFRYVMSHVTGKIEIIGSLDGSEMLFKYHQSKYPENSARVFARSISDNQAWLEDISQ